MFEQGEKVKFIHNNKVLNGTIWSAIGGVSWQNYYIETPKRTYLIGEPMIRKLPTVKEGE